MSLRGWVSKEVTSPRGQWSLTNERRKGNPSRASIAQNMRFQPGIAKTRPGTAKIFSAAGLVNGMVNWIAPDGGNWVLYREGNAIKALLQGSGFHTLLNGIGATYRPSFADLDVWMYFCGYDINGYGTLQARTFDGVNVDKAFAPPIQFTGSSINIDTSDPNALVTIGNHYFGFVYQNRDGFLGVPTTDVRVAITATTNGSPDVLTAPGHTLVDGDVVVISGMTGDTAPNGAQRIVYNVSGSTFSVKDAGGTPIDGNGAYTGGGIVVNPLTIETVAAGSKIIITVTLPARTDGGTNPSGGQSTLFLIATPTDNPAAWFFVPPATGTSTTVNEQPVPYNTPVTLTFVYDTDDTTLRQGDSALNQFLLLAQAADGTGPFNPNFVVAYGQRMCYGAGTVLYASDINAPQQIAPDRNAVVMPNRRYIGAAFPLPGGTDLYLTGEKWTSRITDNSDIPATWSQPVKVSDSLGAPFMNCVCANTKSGWVWVATEFGVYLFNGIYADKPITYLQDDLWKRVNWQAAYAVEMADDVKKLRLYVAVPLDGATAPTNVIVIDYSNCASAPVFDQVDVSVDTYGNRPNGLFGGVGVVLDSDTIQTTVWLGPAAGGGDVVQFADALKNDVDTPIHWFWESGLVRLPQEVETALLRVGQMMVWAHGNTNQPQDLLITIYGPDRKRSVSPALLKLQGNPTRLTEEPGLSYMTKSDLNRVENFTVRFEGNAVDCWIELSSFSPYYKQSSTNR